PVLSRRDPTSRRSVSRPQGSKALARRYVLTNEDALPARVLLTYLGSRTTRCLRPNYLPAALPARPANSSWRVLTFVKRQRASMRSKTRMRSFSHPPESALSAPPRSALPHLHRQITRYLTSSVDELVRTTEMRAKNRSHQIYRYDRREF